MSRKLLAFLLLVFLLTSFFQSGRWSLAPMVVIASAIGLVLIHQLPAWRGYLLLVLATYAALLAGWRGLAPFPMPIYPLFMLANALVGCLVFLLDRRLRYQLGNGLASTLVYPLAATAIEFLLVGGGPLGSFGATAYAVVDSPALSQLIALTGMWGLSFLLAWLASILAGAFMHARAGRPYGRGLVIGAAVTGLVIGGGSARLHAATPPADHLTVAGLTAAHTDMAELMGQFGEERQTFVAQTRQRHATYLEMSREAAGRGADVVLWTELAGLGVAEDVEQLLADGHDLAAELGVYLAMPVFVLSEEEGVKSTNKLVLAGPDGTTLLEHVKYGGNLIEGTEPGLKEIQFVDTPFGRLSAVICWDTDYPDVIRQAGQAKVDLLLSPAYIWPEAAELHVEMASFRAIENGMTIVRHSDDGYSAVIDPYGRIVAREDFVGADRAVFLAEVPIGRIDTLYSALGDFVGQLSALGLALVIGLALWRRVG